MEVVVVVVVVSPLNCVLLAPTLCHSLSAGSYRHIFSSSRFYSNVWKMAMISKSRVLSSGKHLHV